MSGQERHGILNQAFRLASVAGLAATSLAAAEAGYVPVAEAGTVNICEGGIIYPGSENDIDHDGDRDIERVGGLGRFQQAFDRLEMFCIRLLFDVWGVFCHSDLSYL